MQFLHIYIIITFHIINLSPQHPATHGVLRLITISHAELIKWICPEIGLLHRGTEKLIECNYYNSNIGYSLCFNRYWFNYLPINLYIVVLLYLLL